MANLDKAISVAREAVADLSGCMATDSLRLEQSLCDLLAALDAARGETVACDCDWPLLGNCKSCAPPAAAVPESVQQVVAEMLAIAPTCENDWNQQLCEWAAMLAHEIKGIGRDR